MKRCKNITCWTDYPFTELGDVAGKEAPIRRVRAVSYDQDKYVKVKVLGYSLTTDVKRGYLYRTPGRLGEVKNVTRRKFERMI